MRNHLALLAVLVWPAIPLFWIPVHGFNRFFRKIGLLTYALPLVTWLPLAYLIYLKRMYLLSHTIFIPSALLLVGMIALVGGLLLQLWTLRLLSFRGITGMTEVSEKHPGRFVTRGPFSVVRHPTYLSHTMMLLGVFLITGVVTIAVVTVLDFFLIHAVVIPLEDRELLSRFGKEYMKYKREVPRFFPKFRLRRLDMGADELFEEGKKLFLEGKIEDSIDAFSKALDAGAEPGITFLSRGTAYLKLKNPDDALADFSRAVEIKKTLRKQSRISVRL
jgi:protein-S-isoprenylcysteine O-methyltransferase Ste14